MAWQVSVLFDSDKGTCLKVSKHVESCYALLNTYCAPESVIAVTVYIPACCHSAVGCLALRLLAEHSLRLECV